MRLGTLAGIVAALCLLIAALAVAPFLLTTELTRFALRRAFPDAAVDVGGAKLFPSGMLVLRDLVLQDAASPAPRPVVTAREATAVFDWIELASWRVRHVRVDELTVYARPDERSQLALLDILSRGSRSAESKPPSAGGPPFWIDALEVRGAIRHEAGSGAPPASGGWPLMVQMAMSGERTSPSRRFQLAIGAADPSAQLPAGGFGLRAEVDAEPVPEGTRVTVRNLTARDAALAMKADAVRRYAPKLPAALDGEIDSRLRALDLSGRIDLRGGMGSVFDGDIRVRDLSVQASGEQPFALERLTIAGKVTSPIDRFTPAAVALRDFTARLSSLRYGANALEDFDASWRVHGQTVVADRFGFRIFGGRVSGAPAWNFATHAITRCDLAIESLDVHQALANLSPENFDAEGRVSGRLHLLTDPEARLTGLLDLAFDGPGTLRIGEIEEVKQMLAGNFGLDLANLAMRDLRRYPFREGRLSLESAGTNSELRLKFVRQPRTDADAMPPRKEIINGQEILVGSLVVPTIDMTIPITGKSLAEILTMVSGFRPLIEAVSTEYGK